MLFLFTKEIKLFIMGLLNVLNVANYCNINAVANTLYPSSKLYYHLIYWFPFQVVYLIILSPCAYSIFHLVVGAYNICLNFFIHSFKAFYSGESWL